MGTSKGRGACGDVDNDDDVAVGVDELTLVLVLMLNCWHRYSQSRGDAETAVCPSKEGCGNGRTGVATGGKAAGKRWNGQ